MIVCASHCLSLHLVFLLSSFLLHAERALRAVPLALRRFSDANAAIVKPLYGALKCQYMICACVISQLETKAAN